MKTIAAVALGLVFAGANAAAQPTTQPSTTTITTTTTQPSTTTSVGDEPSAPKSAGKEPTAASQIPREELEKIVVDLTAHVNEFCDDMVESSGGVGTAPGLIDHARAKLFGGGDDGGFKKLIRRLGSQDLLTDDIVRCTTEVLKYTPGLVEAMNGLTELKIRKEVELAKEGAANGVN